MSVSDSTVLLDDEEAQRGKQDEYVMSSGMSTPQLFSFVALGAAIISAIVIIVVLAVLLSSIQIPFFLFFFLIVQMQEMGLVQRKETN